MDQPTVVSLRIWYYMILMLAVTTASLWMSGSASASAGARWMILATLLGPPVRCIAIAVDARRRGIRARGRYAAMSLIAMLGLVLASRLF